MRQFLFFSGLWMCVFGVNASENYYFRHYSNKDGLSHHTVFCSLQDSKGFMWFGTDDGLNRFDGHSFQVFRRDDAGDTNGALLNDHIAGLFEDSSGKIWICTSGGVCYYDYETDSFHPFAPDAQSPAFRANQIAEDKNGHLWLRNYAQITRYDALHKSFQVFNPEACGFHSTTMTMTTQGFPVFADASALFAYYPETENFNRLVDLTDYRKNRLTVITSLMEVPQEGFLIGTDLEGLLFYHVGSGRIETVIPEIYVRSIMPYNANTYWIASESGIFIYNLVDKAIVNLKKSLTNEYAIADNAVYSLTKDREGGIWVTSFFGGINYLSKNHTNFTYYIGGKTHPDMLGNTVREICPDQYGNLWLGTEDNGINCFHPATNRMRNYSPLHPERTLAATNIHGLYAAGDTLWIGYFNRGIELLHIPTGRILTHYTHSNTNNRLPSNFVLCFCRTREGRFLIGTSAGVVVYDRQTGDFSAMEGLGGIIRQILEDREGNIWVSSTTGAYRYTPATTTDDGARTEATISRYVASDASRNQGLGSTNTTSVFEDSKGRIWVTTAHGFSLYNKHTDSFNKITKEDGLPSNMIYRIVEDENNYFWISTANGLVRFNPDTHAMHLYAYSDGLHETQFNYSSSYRDADGTIYMGTISGMISFNPRQFTRETYAPPLYITRIQTPDHPQRDRFLQRHTPDEDSYVLKLPHHAATFSISYIAPGYTSPDAIKYAYLLEGVDKEWIDMQNDRNVTFASLAPGKYVFKVRSTDANGVWQANERRLPIVITPPFWMTPWAFLLYAACIATLAALFYRYKKQTFFKEVKRNRELFEMEKEKELYNAKIQFFTFITHEIRTPLTLIKAPLEKMMQSVNNSSDENRHHLQLMEQNTQRLLDLSNQLLDFRKTESRGFRLNFVKTNVTVLLENTLAQFAASFHREQKTFTFDLGERHLFAYVDRGAFTKIVTNLLTNALKYSAKEASLQMTLADDNQSFCLEVKNDGFVVPEKERESIFSPFYRLKETENMQGSGIGLSLSRTLSEFHSGTLVYRETPGGRNSFLLTLPVMQEGYHFDFSETTAVAEEKPVAASDKYMLLIVEDQSDMRRFLAGELGACYEIREAANGREALNVLESQPVDLIISDVMMPLMDGFALCNAVKNNVLYSHLPFILLTAQHNLKSRLTGLNQGADAYMEKPFSPEHLAAQVENLLKNRERLRRSYLEKPQTPLSSLAFTPIDSQFIEKLNTFIEHHLTDAALNVEMVAHEMNMSSSTLYRKVKALSDLSPIDFIRIARLKKAVQLIQHGEKRVNEIAYLTGFSSPAYFSTSFQKQYGKSPSEFIKETTSQSDKLSSSYKIRKNPADWTENRS
jgi:signal transduction histidine kinase/ligand-binding sensor domain-containing protein/DNA-binding response OmpR family regulator